MLQETFGTIDASVSLIQNKWSEPEERLISTKRIWVWLELSQNEKVKQTFPQFYKHARVYSDLWNGLKVFEPTRSIGKTFKKQLNELWDGLESGTDVRNGDLRAILSLVRIRHTDTAAGFVTSSKQDQDARHDSKVAPGQTGTFGALLCLCVNGFRAVEGKLGSNRHHTHTSNSQTQRCPSPCLRTAAGVPWLPAWTLWSSTPCKLLTCFHIDACL